MILLFSAAFICLMFAGLFIYVRAKNGANVDGILTKTLASFCFVIGGVFACVFLPKFQIDYALILMGLICGMVGDIILELKMVYKENSRDYLSAGMLAFGVGHIAYISGISFIMSNLSYNIIIPLAIAAAISVALTVIITIVSKKVLKLNYGSHTILTIGYTFLLTLACVYTFILALSVNYLFIMFAGLLLILLSDMVLSQQYFGTKADSRAFHIINHTLYYLGQITIMCYLFVIGIIK